MTVASPAQQHRAGRLRRGLAAVVAGTALTLGVLLLAHEAVPGATGSLVDSALPWAAAPVVPLIAVAVLTRRRWAIAATAVPLLIWAAMFAPSLTDRATAGPHDLRVASLNLGSAAPDAALAPLLRATPDVIVLEEITTADRKAVTAALNSAYPHHAAAGTVAVFSRLPLSHTTPVDIRIGWTRALATTVTTPNGPVRVYAAHLASARADMTAKRDRTLEALAAAVHADPSPRLVLAGDLNTATTDRRFAALAPLRDTQQDAGAGFGFTWPDTFPVVRPDHLLQLGMATRRSWVLRAPGSDHRAVLADLDTTAPPDARS
ncbi:endonuclease/exonuclease/phosphatase family protein [Actinoplanes sp. NPDC048988]|uniref:endonuclease/exonuclease/phosphatase family protein n=1 Tax=Actinoplanes sp. NPDC048988 TaxID=3363901 RepID=UPI003710FD0A